MDFVVNHPSIKSAVPALELLDNGELKSGNIDSKDCLKSQVSGREELPTVCLLARIRFPR